MLICIAFDRKGSFSIGDEVGRNVIIFGVDMSSSSHIDKLKDILILGKGPTQGLERTLTAEKYERKYKMLFKLALQWSK